MLRKLLLLCGITFFLPKIIQGQCPVSDFSIPSASCLQENIHPTNTSIGASTYKWDFCSGDFELTPTVATIGTSNALFRGRSIRIAKMDTIWVGFAIDQANNYLVRFNFGNSLSNTPIITNLGNPSSLLSSAYDLIIFMESNEWFMLVVNSTTSHLIRYSFGTDLLNNSPSGENMGNLGVLSTPNNLSLVQDLGNIFVFVSNGATNSISRLVFGSSILNTPSVSSFNVTGINNPRGIDVVKDCDQWIGLVTSYSGNKVFYLDFQTSLLNTPLTGEITFYTAYNFPAGLSIIFEGGQYYALIQSALGAMYKLSFGNSIANLAGTGLNLGNFGLASNFANEWVAIDSKWYGFSIELGNSSTPGAGNLIRYTFPTTCSAIPSVSTIPNPQVQYAQEGVNQVTLEAKDVFENNTSLNQSITISPSVAPQASLQTFGKCGTAPITFNGQLVSGDISAWSWDFGDGVGFSAMQNDTYTYGAVGNYTVKLSVTDVNGCTNFTQETITVYDPSSPDFTLPSGLVCTNEWYTFTNNTVDLFDGHLTYEWQINGVPVGTERHLQYAFTSGGPQEIKLITSIPGCDVLQIQSLTNVTEGATPAFSTQNDCVVSPINFVNQSIGGVSYEWHFGDGTTSTDENPVHQYSISGTYDVLLKVTNAAGCVTTTQNQVVAHAVPIAAFMHDLSCSGAITTFTDESIIDNTANIVEWEWTFGDGATYDVQHPEHVFETSGEFGVNLTVRTNNGCESTTTNTVSVRESPTANFTIEEQCIGNPFQFDDTSTTNGSGSIISYVWDIGGTPYSESQVTHTFDVAQTYQTKLTVQSSNQCIDSKIKSITVNALPVASFTVSNVCKGEETVFVENSSTPNDQVTEWEWTINGILTSNEAIMKLPFEEEGDYEVMLHVITNKGCDVISSIETVSIHDKPVASFFISTNYGSPPLSVQTTNLSKKSSAYLWDFGGLDYSTEINPTYNFEEGIHTISLTAINQYGCDSTISKTIYAVNPSVDLQLIDVLEMTSGEYVMMLKNNSNIPIDSVSVAINLGNNVEVNEVHMISLLPGDIANQKVAFSITDVSDLGYLCFELKAKNLPYNDINASNNRQCITVGDDNTEIVNVYPNPVKDALNIPFVAEEGEQITIKLIDAKGGLALNETYTAIHDGWNDLQLDLTLLLQGIYMVQIQLGDELQTHRILVE